MVSADGSFIRLTTGAWREVKSVAVGEFATVKTRAGQEVVKTQQLSYFTRSYGARDFEYFALPELTRRGVGTAQTVVAVNDGAQWLEEYNAIRPHDSLGGMTPYQYASVNVREPEAVHY